MAQLQAWVLSIVLFCLIFLGDANSVLAEVKMKAGVGYEFLSQQFFLDSAINSGVDSLFTDWQLKSTYLDDLKGLFSISVSPFESNILKMQSSYEQTADFFRLRMLSNIDYKDSKNRLQIDGEFEWRDILRDSVDFGQKYIYGYGRSKYSRTLSKSLSGMLQLKGEAVSFAEQSDFSYNYQRFGGKIGLTKSWDNFSYADLRFFIGNRLVPDSSDLNYSTFGGEISYLGFLPFGELDLFTRVENKNYNRPDGRDDQIRGELSARSRVRLGAKFFTRQELEIDAVSYSSDDILNSDYIKSGLTLLVGLDLSGLSMAIGPDLGFLDEKQSDIEEGEDYKEFGLKSEFNYLKSTNFFLSFESTTGHRSLTFENEFQTNYTYERVSLLGDASLFWSLSLNVLFSAEWEWHQLKENNSELYLLSSNVVFSF